MRMQAYITGEIRCGKAQLIVVSWTGVRGAIHALDTGTTNLIH